MVGNWLIFLEWLKRHFWLICIFLLAIFLRFWRLGYPSTLYFDEVYHVPAIELISRADWTAFEWWHLPYDGQNYFDWLHPPFAKYVQAGFVWVGREIFQSTSPIWWRLPSAVAGATTVLVGFGFTKWVAEMWIFKAKSKSQSKTRLLAREKYPLATIPNVAGLLAALIIASDGLLLVQSRIAMNDSIFVLLQFLSIWVFFRFITVRASRPQLSVIFGLVMGLALATKWSGVFFWITSFGTVIVCELADLVKKQTPFKKIALTAPLHWFGVLIVPAAVYLVMYIPVAISHNGYQFVWQLHQQIVGYQLNRDSNHAYASRPWQWLLNSRPVWYWQDQAVTQIETVTESNSKPLQTANIYAFSHPLLPVVSMLSLLAWIVFLVTKMVKKEPINLWFWWFLLAYSVCWMPWFFSPRIMFYYHYAPAIPVMAVMIGIQSTLWWQRFPKIVVSLIVVWVLVVMLWVPHWLGLRVPKTMADTIYFALSGWR